MPERILEVDDLRVEFHTDDGVVRAVDGVSFAVERGQTLGIVGESGSGKTVANLALLGLVPQPPGRVAGGRAVYQGQDLLAMTERQLARIRGNRIAMIFQDPMTSLNPFLTVERQLTEVTQLHLGYDRRRARAHAVEMLERVGIPAAAERLFDYPHQFSGGMRQRVMIAMALSCSPDLLIADEPTTALDVTIQAQILELMKQLQQEHGTSIILISHDLGVIANACRQVCVMYAGKVVERAPVEALFARPAHPYTLGLLGSVPRWDDRSTDALRVIPGQPPDLMELPAGCPFAPRCDYRLERCLERMPPEFSRPDGAGTFACLVDIQTGEPHGASLPADADEKVQHG